jgi:hypothetical protein
VLALGGFVTDEDVMNDLAGVVERQKITVSPTFTFTVRGRVGNVSHDDVDDMRRALAHLPAFG